MKIIFEPSNGSFGRAPVLRTKCSGELSSTIMKNDSVAAISSIFKTCHERILSMVAERTSDTKPMRSRLATRNQRFRNADRVAQGSYPPRWCRPGSFTPAPTPNRTCKFPSIRLSRCFCSTTCSGLVLVALQTQGLEVRRDIGLLKAGKASHGFDMVGF